MPRPPRLLLSKSYYHVMTRGNNKNRVFRSPDDYEYYLKRFAKYKKEHRFDLFHYCLMPTHVHQIIRTCNAGEYSQFMKKINLSYFHYYRHKYGWIGHFWQDRFKSQPVGKDEYFIQCGKYIELNPVRKGLVSDPKNYQYSSYGYYALGNADKLVTRDPFYGDQNSDQNRKEYREMVIEDLVEKNYSVSIWGSRNQRYNERNKREKHISKLAGFKKGINARKD